MIDKGLYKKGRVGLKGGADASQFGRPSSQQQTVNVGAGGATLGNTPLTTYNPPSGGDSGDDGSPFRKTPPKKKKPVQTFLKQGVDYARKNPLQVLLGFLNPAFGAAMLGANFLNDPERRKRLTGYETQEEYDQARQDRINLNRIKTLENTIQKKYLDKNRSLDETNLDERLAALKSQMGITPNTAADLRPDLDFSNNPELAFEGVATKVPGGITDVMINEFGQSPQFTTSLINEFGVKDRGILDTNQGLQFGSIPGTSDQGYVSPFGTADDVTANLLGVPGTADDVTANLLGLPGSADDPYANLLGVPGTADYYG